MFKRQSVAEEICNSMMENEERFVVSEQNEKSIKKAMAIKELEKAAMKFELAGNAKAVLIIEKLIKSMT